MCKKVYIGVLTWKLEIWQIRVKDEHVYECVYVCREKEEEREIETNREQTAFFRQRLWHIKTNNYRCEKTMGRTT